MKKDKIQKISQLLNSRPRLVALLYFLFLSCMKMKAYLLSGRIFAEEGKYFYTSIRDMGFFNGLFYIFNGHLELVTNIVVALSTLVRFEFAPLILTYLSFSFQMVPIGLIIYYFRQLGLSFWGLCGFLTIYAGLPQSPEVWANSINLHFHFALLAALILVLTEKVDYPRWPTRIALLFCGLSGIPCNFLGPIFLYRAVVIKNREKWIHFFIISFTCGIQLLLIYLNRDSMVGRDIDRGFLHFLLPILSQQFISPFLGLKVGGAIIDILREALRIRPLSIALTLFCSSLAFVWLRFALKYNARVLHLFLICAAFSSVFSILGSLGGKEHIISPGAGGRYFFVSNVLVYLCVMITSKDLKNRLYKFVVSLLMFSSIILVGRYMSGPSWPDEYARIINENAEYVRIWPDGWTMINPLKENR